MDKEIIDRRKKWKTLSAQRMTRVLQTTELIANLSSHNYEFEDEWLQFLLKRHKEKGIEIRGIFENPSVELGKKLSSKFVFPEISMETQLTLKQIKFIEIAQKRMSNLYKEMNYLGRLANTKNYTYDLMDVDYIFEIYEAKSEELRMWFPPFKNERIENVVKISDYPSEN